jgi:hypothetical protein
MMIFFTTSERRELKMPKSGDMPRKTETTKSHSEDKTKQITNLNHKIETTGQNLGESAVKPESPTNPTKSGDNPTNPTKSGDNPTNPTKSGDNPTNPTKSGDIDDKYNKQRSEKPKEIKRAFKEASQTLWRGVTDFANKMVEADKGLHKSSRM